MKPARPCVCQHGVVVERSPTRVVLYIPPKKRKPKAKEGKSA